MPKTYNDIYFSVRNKLRESGVEAFSLEARILLAAAAGKTTEQLMRDMYLYTSPEIEEKAHSMIERIQRDFQLGGHKAAAIAMVLEDADIYLVSELSEEKVRSLFLQPAADVQSALDEAFARLGDGAGVLVMPYGGSTLPKVRGE